MDSKKIQFLMMLLLAVGAVYYASERLSAKKSQKAEVNLAAGFEAAKAAAITVRSPGSDAVSLKKKDGRWTVTSGKSTYDADAAAPAALLGQIGNMKSATMASKNPKNFDAFEVSDSKAVEVKIEDDAGAVLAWVLLGKNGPDIFSTYVRAQNSQNVYLVPGMLKSSADRSLNDWRDKTLRKLDPDKINLYSVSGDRDLQLRKTPAGSWQSICGGRVSDCPSAGQIIRSFAALAAADFSDNSTAQARLDKPRRTITAILADGTSSTLTMGMDKNAFQQFVKTGAQDQVYVVEKSQLDSLSPTCEELKNIGEAPDPDAAAPGSTTK